MNTAVGFVESLMGTEEMEPGKLLGQNVDFDRYFHDSIRFVNDGRVKCWARTARIGQKRFV
jgi:hypothetical protein